MAICTNGEIGTSADGLTWEYRQTGTDLNEVVAGDGEFLVHGDSGILKSEDGLDWTLHEETPQISGSTLEIRYGNGIYLAADGKWLYTSTDGITWEQNEGHLHKGEDKISGTGYSSCLTSAEARPYFQPASTGRLDRD